VTVEVMDIVNAIRNYQRRFAAKPSSLYVSRAGRAHLWDGFANAPGVGDAPEPPLHVPIYVQGIPVWALHGVEEGSVTAIHEPAFHPRERGALDSLLRVAVP